MTQELILGALLIGMIGFLWALTCAIMDGDRPMPESQQSVAVHPTTNAEPSSETALPHRNVA